MKKSLIYLLVAASIISVGCSEDFLDPVRNTNVVTSEDIAANANLNPALLEGSLNGIGSLLIEPAGITGTRHYDLGQKGVDIWLDILSGDMALSANSYGWYRDTANLVSTVDFSREENSIIWRFYYKVIALSNNVINSFGGNDAAPTTSEARHIYAQAKAYRAYAYFYLAQIFQRAYDPSQAILPYNDGNDANISYAKVPASQIYDLIISDLTQSVQFLSDFTPSSKQQISQHVAKGLLAYTYAAMGNYTDAKTLSDEIISSGAYSMTTTGQLAFPGSGSGFNDVNTESWMWGYDLTLDLGHQLLDWWGQMDYFTYSYQWAGDRKTIDNGLLALIPANDVRRSQFGTSGTSIRMPINKFFSPDRVVGGQQVITTDLIFMRVDEFYLLSAEAAAKSGNEAAAKARLKELLASRLGGSANADAYVDPLTGAALREAIYRQTRIELWGEGKSYLAMKRNQATVTRGTNHVFRAGQSFLYDSDEMSFQIPQLEMDNNSQITGQN
ncbi:RagB/SusD family nutrient uptake outer membrane protein [Flavobacterium channae]|uniref:RagB/SusD family nutrient uptake outer membrane protein n=1 Tax=Flavobacterium channae TaxID=2897181 RepID=UPI001E55C0EF|nr:RagB/SusD family nutrient uptake outer membrane protein [Flavobacterium channae]UGS23091.1 RagB/SusD family nutrient uptake outer membrane protein [Flavobacterium channae]